MSSVSRFALLLIAGCCFVFCQSKVIASSDHKDTPSLANFLENNERLKRSQPLFAEYGDRNELESEEFYDIVDPFKQLSPETYQKLLELIRAWILAHPVKPKPRLGRRNTAEARQTGDFVQDGRAKTGKVRALYPPRLGKRTEQTCD